MTCTQEQADAWLEQDVHEAELSVQGLVEVTLTPNQFSALVSFEYNTGGLAGSTMLRYLNEGNFAGAAEEFPLWDWAGGVQLPGLDRRRAAEKALFLTP
jgi:lysozyme